MSNPFSQNKMPVLFIFFNRVDTALTSFESIRRYRPGRLYLASDGARDWKQGEDRVVQDLRDRIVASIDWECEVQTFFREKNYGCGTNVHDAISWLFDHEERGIVLEDDCFAGEDFFPFMETLLEKYRDDMRVGMVAGINIFAQYTPPSSYLFSRNYICWGGWGSWRNRWRQMDFAMEWRQTPYAQSIIHNNGCVGKDLRRYYWEMNYIDHGWVSSWDWQWYFSLASQNQLCIFPSVNLVTNIGTGADATHTAKAEGISFAQRRMEFPLRHPPYVVPDIAFENLSFRRSSSLERRVNRMIPHQVKEVKNKMLKLLHWK